MTRWITVLVQRVSLIGIYSAYGYVCLIDQSLVKEYIINITRTYMRYFLAMWLGMIYCLFYEKITPHNMSPKI